METTESNYRAKVTLLSVFRIILVNNCNQDISVKIRESISQKVLQTFNSLIDHLITMADRWLVFFQRLLTSRSIAPIKQVCPKYFLQMAEHSSKGVHPRTIWPFSTTINGSQVFQPMLLRFSGLCQQPDFRMVTKKCLNMMLISGDSHFRHAKKLNQIGEMHPERCDNPVYTLGDHIFGWNCINKWMFTNRKRFPLSLNSQMVHIFPCMSWKNL